MLVLSRKVGESIVIGAGIVVKVVGVHGRQVRLGIDAPPEVPILREELDRSQWAAAHATSPAGVAVSVS